ncbi:hypothetical protein HBE96_15580 [Clostridium sp. P21]|uniref:Uncharacterized protein n=1 Tax=Clostridium muellerianum TaxID=2716538 RepID=A0A7Y0EIF6_9CLOT|nr:hypothetical protein [Clostridium muellerianum]NMM64063.1 hypothetical protein [Clostridium muellerianum]
MNLLKKLLIWSIIAVLIESGMLFYLDKAYSAARSDYKEVKSTAKSEKKAYNEIKVPENAENIQVSYDGKYVSYCEDNVLKIANSQDSKIQSIDINSNSSICYSRWLPDTNWLLICEKDTKDRINFYNYNPNKSSKNQLIDHDMKPLIIELDNKSDKIEDIALSTANHVMYTKILHKSGKSDIYGTNVMGQVEKIKTSNNKIGNISMLNLASNLIYEDKEEDEIKNLTQTVVKNKKGDEKKLTDISSIDFDDDSRKVLLGTDTQDRIYAGILESGKVSQVILGELKDSTSPWKKLKLSALTDKDNIVITAQGNMYIKDKSQNSVKNAVTNAETKYNGKFIEIQNKYIYSLYDNKVIRTELK